MRMDGRLDSRIIDAAVTTMLDRHADATVCAIGPDGLVVDMPDSVPRAGHDLVRARSVLNIVVAADRGVVISAWERARAVGASRAPVRLAADPERPVVVYFLDARKRHGVYLGLVVAAEGEDAVRFDPQVPGADPRFARPGKTVLEAAAEVLGARQHMLARLGEALPVGVLHVDAQRRVLYSNNRLHDLLGCPRATTLDEQLATVVDRDRMLVDATFAAALSDGVDDDITVALLPPSKADADVRQCTLSVRALTDERGAVTGAIICASDLGDAGTGRAGLRPSTFDVLTRCHNRASTMAGLQAMLAGSGGGSSPAVILIDLDNFKKLNDAQGRDAGDEFLGVVARRLHGAVREDDLVGRIGGDEFLVVLAGIATAAEAVRTAVRLGDSLSREIQLKNVKTVSRASIGVAWSSGGDTDPETLVLQADTAMRESKRRGLGRPVLFVPSLPPARPDQRREP